MTNLKLKTRPAAVERRETKDAWRHSAVETARVLKEGLESHCARVERQEALYLKLLSMLEQDTNTEPVYRISSSLIFRSIIEAFGPALNSKDAGQKLESIYDIGLHKQSGALIIANKGATLFCLSPKTETPCLSRHIGFAVYLPGLGLEFVNVGLVGNVYSGKVVCRSESACSPSFLFGSQRCNCAHQWDSIRELAAHFNKVEPPSLKTGAEFENWVQAQAVYKEGKHIFNTDGPGFVLMHLDCQNGMGSGYTKGEFAYDLFSRASIRHRGEYSSEQLFSTSMSGGFKAIGLTPDPRSENDNIGYSISAIVLDFLGVSRELIFLSNNAAKLNAAEAAGYFLTRVKTLGAVNLAGAQEAEERGLEFGHQDINCRCVSFQSEFERVKGELSDLLNI